jgi:hypothetical protein
MAENLKETGAKHRGIQKTQFFFSRRAPIFQKSRRYLKNLGARNLREKNCVLKKRQMSGATLQKKNIFGIFPSSMILSGARWLETDL